MRRCTRRLSGAALALGVAASAAACGGDGSAAEARWRAEVDTIGDTVVVHTAEGAVRGPARLVEELRIGREEGEDHEMFGRIGGVAATPDGGVVVYDAQVPALRRFGPDGAYRGTIGRGGSGPGEYRNATGMAVLDDGRIVLSDFGNGRFNVYDAGGTLTATWPLRPAVGALRPLHATGDHVFLHDMRFGPNGERREILVRLDAAGAPVDTMDVPRADHDPPALEARSSDGSSIGTYLPFAPARSWTVTPAGHVAVAIGDRYAIDVHRGDGSVLRISRDTPPVPVTDEERAAEEARVTAFFRRHVPGWRWAGPPLPERKPPISWIHAGRQGRIWVRVAQPGTAIPEAERVPRARSHVREPIVLDVFDPDGRYLGPVAAPESLRLLPFPVFDGETVWGVVADEAGVEYVARFRVEPAAGADPPGPPA